MNLEQTADAAATSADAEGRLLYLAENLAALHGAPDMPWLTGRFEFLGEKALGAAVSVLAIPDDREVYRPANTASPRPAHARDLWNGLEIDDLAHNEAAIAVFREAERAGRPVAHDLSSVFWGRNSVSGVSTAIAAPIAYNRELIGIGLWVVETSPLTLQMAGILAEHTAVAVYRLRQHEEARRLHSVDPHLWVPDEHFLMTQLKREVLRARRYGREVGVAVLRVENEAEIRAKFGDFFTNHLMRRIGSQLLADVRDSDVLGALDGAYAVIHTETPLEGTRFSGERLSDGIRRMVAQRFPEAPAIEMSMVAAGFPESGESIEALLTVVAPQAEQDQLAA